MGKKNQELPQQARPKSIFNKTLKKEFTSLFILQISKLTSRTSNHV